jgi:hypothetical protein
MVYKKNIGWMCVIFVTDANYRNAEVDWELTQKNIAKT